MTAKDAFYFRLRQPERMAKENGKKSLTRVVTVPKSKRPTQKSIAQTGERITSSFKHRHSANRCWGDDR